MSEGTANPDDAPRRGRPSKLTEAVFEKFVAVLKGGNYRVDACRTVGVAPKTFRKWMETGEEFPDGIYGRFRTAVIEAESQAKTDAVAAILAVGHSSDPKYLCWWLERKFPSQYGAFRGEVGELKRRIREMEKILTDAGQPADQATA